MLPSGNDAANELAIWASSYGSQVAEKKLQLKWFICQMNSFAQKLGLKNSKFMNVHGLPHQDARSTAADIAMLCCECLKIDLFSKIVSTKKYKILIRNTII
jgi:D-alanyl-D-alanine carboxypeptidase